MLTGATVVLPGSAETGLFGSSQTDAGRLLDTLSRSAASTTILVPEMLKTLVGALQAGGKPPDRLRFAAVGGATVAPGLLAEATERGLPVFEGYGLSECGSVVSLNVPAQHRPGSVGRPLPHVRVSVDDAGEISVGGAVMLGYAGAGETPPPWPTGDLGRIDADGFLHITGRKRNVFITSFGRNVSPEWVEARLTASPLIAQAAVFGEGRPWNTAVLVSPAADAFEGRALIDRHIAAVNADLPDYARVSAWIEADAPFAPENDQLTPSGRPRRDAIWRAYRGAVTLIYGDKQRALSR
jgi:acyl-CoA synthetase (AMP-forming)/AMP-acid ligase II